MWDHLDLLSETWYEVLVFRISVLCFCYLLFGISNFWFQYLNTYVIVIDMDIQHSNFLLFNLILGVIRIVFRIDLSVVSVWILVAYLQYLTYGVDDFLTPITSIWQNYFQHTKGTRMMARKGVQIIKIVFYWIYMYICVYLIYVYICHIHNNHASKKYKIKYHRTN